MLVVVLLRLKMVELLLNGLESEGEGERVMDVSEGAEESTGCRDSKSFEWALRLGLKRLKILRIWFGLDWLLMAEKDKNIL